MRKTLLRVAAVLGGLVLVVGISVGALARTGSPGSSPTQLPVVTAPTGGDNEGDATETPEPTETETPEPKDTETPEPQATETPEADNQDDQGENSDDQGENNDDQGENQNDQGSTQDSSSDSNDSQDNSGGDD